MNTQQLLQWAKRARQIYSAVESAKLECQKHSRHFHETLERCAGIKSDHSEIQSRKIDRKKVKLIVSNLPPAAEGSLDRSLQEARDGRDMADEKLKTLLNDVSELHALKVLYVDGEFPAFGRWHNGLDANPSEIETDLFRLADHLEHAAIREADACRPEPTGTEVLTAPLDTPPPSSISHSEDFCSVNWYGTQYTFSHNQAACVKVLWGAMENRTPLLFAVTIIENADVQRSDNRLDMVFRDHPAWGKMITTPEKGKYRLSAPAE